LIDGSAIVAPIRGLKYSVGAALNVSLPRVIVRSSTPLPIGVCFQSLKLNS
jgi:hypothetical protein